MSKVHEPAQAKASRSSAAAAPQSAVQAGSGTAFAGNRPEAVAQRELAEAITNSRRVQRQGRFGESVRNSPYMVAQRKHVENLFGRAFQRREKDGTATPVRTRARPKTRRTSGATRDNLTYAEQYKSARRA